MMSAGITLLLFVLLAAGMPVAFALVVSGSIGLYLIGGLDVLAGVITTTPLSTAGSYELISIPMFILMAEFVILSGVADDLFKAASTWVGRVPGGLGMATALAGAGFGAISGSSTASAATLSSTTMPAMLKAGYDPKLAGGVVAISGTLAMLIPPSIALVLYGIIADVALRYLFNAPLQWSYEVISSYLMPGLFFFAASHTLKAHAHVAVDIVHNYVGRRTRYVLEALVSALATPVFALCTVVSAQHTLDDIRTAATSTSGLALPTWTISLMLPIGFGLLTLRLAINAIGYIATLVTGREVTELPPISGTEELTP